MQSIQSLRQRDASCAHIRRAIPERPGDMSGGYLTPGSTGTMVASIRRLGKDSQCSRLLRS
jgi:hypothetical protein